MMRDAFVRHYHKISKWLEISFAQQQSLVCPGRGGPMKFSIIVPLAAPAAPSAMRAAVAGVHSLAAGGAAHIQNFHAHIMIHN